MIDKAFILSGDVSFKIVSRADTTVYKYRVCNEPRGFVVHGAQVGGRLHYLGVLYPESGHLMRTSKTLKTRHTRVAEVFRWLVALLWWSKGLPAGYEIVETL